MNKLDKIGNVSSGSVCKHTKKDWTEWIKVLNANLCQSWSHHEIVLLLRRRFHLTTWWQQEVARGYQIALGIRQPHQTLKGTYTTTSTKTISFPTRKVFSLLVSHEGQELWLRPLYPVKIEQGQFFECEGGIFGEFRKITLNKKLRLSWINEDWVSKSGLQVSLYPKSKGKCMLVIDHSDLPTLKAKSQMHAHWRTAVDQVAGALK